jgi:UDP:flavonoid glycosyltransferase YjiC (YdhE family)
VARFVFAWELGAGMGHLQRIKPIAQRLLSQGHEVWAIVKDLRMFGTVFRDLNVQRLQSPVPMRPANRINPQFTFAQILHNATFGDGRDLAARVRAWRDAFELIRADVLVCDHSPTALVASRGMEMRRVILGTGFICPGVATPMPLLHGQNVAPLEKIRAHEAWLVEQLNSAIEVIGAPRLSSFADLYSQTDATLLATFAELDPYADERQPEYLGCWPYAEGMAPEWPRSGGPRAFAYLKPFAGLETLVQSMKERQLSAIVVCGGLTPDAVARMQSDCVKIVAQPLDMRRACSECEVAILNATHGSTAAALLAGKPILQLPLFLEQVLTAKRVVKLGAGLAARLNQPQQIVGALTRLIGDGKYRDAARAFAAKYESFDAQRQIDLIAERLEQLAAR